MDEPVIPSSSPKLRVGRIRQLMDDNGFGVLIAIVIGFVLASLAAAGIITMGLAVTLLVAAFVVGAAAPHICGPEWFRSNRSKVFTPIFLTVLLIPVYFFERSHFQGPPAVSQSLAATPSPSLPSLPAYRSVDSIAGGKPNIDPAKEIVPMGSTTATPQFSKPIPKQVRKKPVGAQTSVNSAADNTRLDCNKVSGPCNDVHIGDLHTQAGINPTAPAAIQIDGKNKVTIEHAEIIGSPAFQIGGDPKVPPPAQNTTPPISIENSQGVIVAPNASGPISQYNNFAPKPPPPRNIGPKAAEAAIAVLRTAPAGSKAYFRYDGDGKDNELKNFYGQITSIFFAAGWQVTPIGGALNPRYITSDANGDSVSHGDIGCAVANKTSGAGEIAKQALTASGYGCAFDGYNLNPYDALPGAAQEKQTRPPDPDIYISVETQPKPSG